MFLSRPLLASVTVLSLFAVAACSADSGSDEGFSPVLQEDGGSGPLAAPGGGSGTGASGQGAGATGQGTGATGQGTGATSSGGAFNGGSGTGGSATGGAGTGGTGMGGTVAIGGRGNSAEENAKIGTQRDPSFSPPGGLASTDVPVFVVLGFDDNRFPDGMKWVMDLLDSRANPVGSGKAANHDGESIKASFYFSSEFLELGGEELKSEWMRAVNGGHEIANHTHTHRNNENNVPFVWDDELKTCNTVLQQELGLTRDDLIGIRAPFLDFLNPPLFDALERVGGFKYDITIRHDAYSSDPDDWMFYSHVWPYTLENGVHAFTAGGYAIGSHPGVWEVPVYALPTSPERSSLTQPSQSYTGFDSTAWLTLDKSAQDFENSMKWALDFRLDPRDSRAPLTIGLHSDAYSAFNDGYDGTGRNLEQRRAALQNFIDYALTKPEVRFVTVRQLLVWMNNPQTL